MLEHYDPANIRPGAPKLARGYTMVYAVGSDICLAVLAASGVLGHLVQRVANGGVPPAFVVLAVVVLVYAALGNYLYFAKQRQFSQLSVAVSAIAGLGAPVVLWFLVFVVMAHAGHDISQ